MHYPSKEHEGRFSPFLPGRDTSSDLALGIHKIKASSLCYSSKSILFFFHRYITFFDMNSDRSRYPIECLNAPLELFLPDPLHRCPKVALGTVVLYGSASKTL